MLEKEQMRLYDSDCIQSDLSLYEPHTLFILIVILKIGFRLTCSLISIGQR